MTICFSRDSYLNKLKPSIGNGVVKIVAVPRRCGKYNGKFHPGSKKQVGFYGNASDASSILGYTLNYFERYYNLV